MMRRKVLIHILLGVLMAGLFGAGAAQPVVQAQADDLPDRPLLMAHFMPWYQTPDVSGYWGWHWTMDYFDPTKTGANGRSEIASQYTPLTGAYDSQDEDILEYQVLLMKLSGIDGVIVDYYGNEDFRDYAVLNESTVKLFDTIKRAGMRFILCYEDQTIKHMVEDGYITREDAHAHGQMAMQYMQTHFFSDDAYVKYQGHPLLFVYGPQYFNTTQDWDAVFEGIDPKPDLVTLDKHLAFGATATFPWPPMHYAGGIELGQAVLDNYLTLFYRNAQRGDLIVGSAFPGFNDIYAQAGVRSSYGSINPQDGKTMQDTLDLALAQGADIVQLVTWNDYGEGTIIEPTEEFGYQYLEIVQNTRRTLADDGFAATADDLRLPLQLLNLRRAHEDDAEVNTRLDEAFNDIVGGDAAAARTIIESYP